MKNTFNEVFKLEYYEFAIFEKLVKAGLIPIEHRNGKESLDEKIKIFLNSKKATGFNNYEMLRFEAFAEELKGNCIHYFLEDSSIKDFLLSCEVSSDFTFLEKLPDNFEFCIHTTTDKDDFIYRKSGKVFFASSAEGFHGGRLSVGMINFDSPKKQDKEKVLQKDFFKFGLNLIQYIDAFPDCVRDGLPKHFVIKNSFKNKKQTIRLSNKVRIIDSTTRKPHFRRGYFRYLGSDYFVNKKGQTVFIEATFVNGKNAKTVS